MKNVYKKLTLISIMSFFSLNKNYYLNDKSNIKIYKQYLEKNEKNILSKINDETSYDNMLDDLIKKINIPKEELYYLMRVYTNLS